MDASGQLAVNSAGVLLVAPPRGDNIEFKDYLLVFPDDVQLSLLIIIQKILQRIKKTAQQRPTLAGKAHYHRR